MAERGEQALALVGQEALPRPAVVGEEIGGPGAQLVDRGGDGGRGGHDELLREAGHLRDEQLLERLAQRRVGGHEPLEPHAARERRRAAHDLDGRQGPADAVACGELVDHRRDRSRLAVVALADRGLQGRVVRGVRPELDEQRRPRRVAPAEDDEVARDRPQARLEGVLREDDLCVAGDALVDVAVENGEEQLVLAAGEVRVDGPLRVARLVGDPVERRAVEAVALEHRARGGEEVAARPLAALGPGEAGVSRAVRD